MELLSQLLQRHMSDFTEQELAMLNSGYVLQYMDDVQRRSLLRRRSGAGRRPELQGAARGIPMLGGSAEELAALKG